MNLNSQQSTTENKSAYLTCEKTLFINTIVIEEAHHFNAATVTDKFNALQLEISQDSRRPFVMARNPSLDQPRWPHFSRYDFANVSVSVTNTVSLPIPFDSFNPVRSRKKWQREEDCEQCTRATIGPDFQQNSFIKGGEPCKGRTTKNGRSKRSGLDRAKKHWFWR